MPNLNNSVPQAYQDNTTSYSTQNSLATTSIGKPTSAGILNPNSFAALSQFTSLDGSSILSISNRDYYVDDCPVLPEGLTHYTFASEKHISLIRKGPTMPLQLQMFPYEDGAVGDRAEISVDNQNQLHEFSTHFSANSYNTDDAIINASFTGDKMPQSSNYAFKFFPNGAGVPYFISEGDLTSFNPGAYWGDPNGDWNTKGTSVNGEDISIFYDSNQELVETGAIINIPIDVTDTGQDWEINDNIIIEHEFLNSFGNREKATSRLQIVQVWTGSDDTYNALTECTLADCDFHDPTATSYFGYGWYPCGTYTTVSWASPLGSGMVDKFCHQNHLRAKIISITDNFPVKAITPNDLYNVYLVQKPPIFKLKFPKFGYRYKYEDGEYSVFSPWSEVAFVPGVFDYLPKKGFNLGMENNLRRLNVLNFVPKNIPKDVVQVDILYKESNSPNIYTISSHKPTDDPDFGQIENYWNMLGTGGHGGFYTIKSELIHKVVQSNQLLRPWDNVPRKALAQEVTANRLIFANYVQNYDVKNELGIEITPQFTTSISSIDHTINGDNLPGYPGKSLKSMRTYQLGIVYRDTYGRETPVLTSKSGSIKIPKASAKLQNRLNVQLHNDAPHWAESFTFYIKETSNEYYNLAMDRWYDADDGGIWLSFPSSERNKISENTNLILKKQHDTNRFADYETKYKVLAISNDAPIFVKTENKYLGSLPMMLPPPGWGQVGGWDSGMFYNSGLPLPNRLYLDIYAEYWDQSVFSELRRIPNSQVRIVQSAGAASAYNAATSDTTNKTKWYDVASVAYIGSPPQTQQVTTEYNSVVTTNEVELPGQQEQLVRISLEKAFGTDASFCEPTDNLSLARGLSLEVRAQIVRDKAQFDGRFFVKILRDANIESNIVQPQLASEDTYQVLLSKKIKYICASHPGTQDWSKKAIATVSGGDIEFDGTGVASLQGSATGIANVPNFIPIAINHGPSTDGDYRGADGNNSKLGTSSGINKHHYNINDGNLGTRMVSSFSKTHANKGASFIDPFGYTPSMPDGAFTGTLPTWPPGQERKWPYGPGDGAVGAFDTNGWGDYVDHAPHLKKDAITVPGSVNKLIWPNYRTSVDVLTDGNIPNGAEVPVISPGNIDYPGAAVTSTDTFNIKGSTYDWPSYGPGIYNPYLRYFSDETGDSSCDLCDNGSFAENASMDRPYLDRVKDSIERQHVLYLDNCPALTNGGSGNIHQHTPLYQDPATASNYYKHNYLQGANPLNVPAIWGELDDFLDSTPVFDVETWAKLSEDWRLLWEGRREEESWPLGSFSPERWFIDKAGAAQGHSGNGIWDDGNVGYMDISYWGVGREGARGLTSRKQSFRDTMVEHNESEVAFADAMATVGTQFRFKHDPDGIIYTITRAQQKEVYNYEAPQGQWGVEDDNGDTSGGYGIGYRSPAPSWSTGENGYLAGGTAFISDLYSVYDNGAHPTNKRLRWTLTLDKIIGAQGDHKFHPITNHVEPAYNIDGDLVYKANIVGGRVEYSDGMGNGVVTYEKGGTVPGVSYYNLASYWNSTQFDQATQLLTPYPTITDIVGPQNNGNDVFLDGDKNGLENGIINTSTTQPDTIQNHHNNFYNRNPFAYIGLHERGLNQTEIEIVTPYKGEDRDKRMSHNPAIWETEPMEDVGLDIYYAASPTYPIKLGRYRHDGGDLDPLGANWYDYLDRGEEVVRVGSFVFVDTSNAGAVNTPTVCKVQDDIIWLTESNAAGSSFIDAANDSIQLNSGDIIRVTWRGEGTYYGVGFDEEHIDLEIVEAISFVSYRVKPLIHNNPIQLGYYNCWSYGTGVETNRIRDDYNAVTIDKGVKASMPLATPYEEERRASGLIFSGIYNSTSGVNDTNQFIQAEPITKDLNPINGSIQKLFARDTDLVTFCENKVFKILAKKDALFNADGNTNITSNAAVLGQAMPFSGEYGISKNPESFASESYRLYFTDKDRGAVLRLSRDGITPISDAGMKDWFRDHTRFATSLIGSFDNRDDHYNLTLDTLNITTREKEAYTVSYTEKKRGWESFKSFIQQDGVNSKNIYYTFPNNYWIRKNLTDPWGEPYSASPNLSAETWQHAIDTDIEFSNTAVVTGSADIPITTSACLLLRAGMYIEGNGIPIDTFVISIDSSCAHVTLSEAVHISDGTILKATTSRNNFYGLQHYSMVTTLFNGDKGTVKRFKTLDYEGTQAKTILMEASADVDTLNYLIEGVNVGQIYYDNYAKHGWYVEDIFTDIQEGRVPEFKSKENKWFNNIIGIENIDIEDSLDTAEFSLQGLGFATGIPSVAPPVPVSGCTDPLYVEYNASATIDDGSCLNLVPVVIAGCMDPTALNYDASATSDDGSCIYPVLGCTDPLICNYNPNANTDDGSCCDPLEICGCTNPFSAATTIPGVFDPLATCDDGSCAATYGCGDPTASNYNPGTVNMPVWGSWIGPNPCNQCVDQACIGGPCENGGGVHPDSADYSIDPGGCIFEGCTDSTASNYDAMATVDNGSCTY